MHGQAWLIQILLHSGRQLMAQRHDTPDSEEASTLSATFRQYLLSPCFTGSNRLRRSVEFR